MNVIKHLKVLFRKVFPHNCICCGKRGAENPVPSFKDQSNFLYQKIPWNLKHTAILDCDLYLCDECKEKDIKAKQSEVAIEQQIKKNEKEEKIQNEYIAQLQAEVNLKELENKAMELGIDTASIKLKINAEN
ncbi:hypothetical protein ABC382_00690 [Lysinibacillus sp. 1P01SD]|uniref:hypothetical protein n=1 Tax=Lysinibacillus sp. 1P01SD TaxID=3132285 RepID=UPI0039A1AFEC